MDSTEEHHKRRSALRRVHPNGIRVRKAVATTLLAVAGLGVSTYYGGLLGAPGPHHALTDRAVAGGSAVVFLVAALIAVRGATEDLISLVPNRFGDSRVTTLRMLCLLTGYAMVVLGALSLLHVPWSKLILGGALTGVIVGIAAQPVLGNIFAGLVLLTARPFHIGEDVAIQAGALGGRIQGRVTDMTLLFVQLRTADGTVLLPNSSVLSSAIAPGYRPPVRPTAPLEPSSPPAPFPPPAPAPTPAAPSVPASDSE
jgi:small-conductance mechanosensitive channel